MREPIPTLTPVPTSLSEKVQELFSDEDVFLQGRMSGAVRSDLEILYDSLRRIWAQATLEEEKAKLQTQSDKLKELESRLERDFSEWTTQLEQQLRRISGKETDWTRKLNKDTEAWSNDINSRRDRLKVRRKSLDERKKKLEERKESYPSLLQQRLSELQKNTQEKRQSLEQASRERKAELEKELTRSKRELANLEKNAGLVKMRRQSFGSRKSALEQLTTTLNARLNQRDTLIVGCERRSMELIERQMELETMYAELQELKKNTLDLRARLIQAGKIKEEEHPESLIF